MATCTSCSAPLPGSSIVCEYCGSRNDVDLKAIHHYTTHETDSDRICPRCELRLRTIDLRDESRFLIERCDRCLGLFFDPNELEALLDTSVTNVFEINRVQLNSICNARYRSETVITYLKCPVCRELMNRNNFGAKSGVIVDRCRQHGVWLDGGELRQLLEWMKAGGMLLQQQKAAEMKQIEADQEKERRRRVAELPSGAYERPEASVMVPDVLDVTIEVLAAAARIFMKL